MYHLRTLLVAGLLLGCNSDPVEPPKGSNVTRNWELTRCEYVNVADHAQSVELIGAGYEIWLAINDNHRFRYSWTPPGDGPEQFLDGAWRIDGSRLVLTPDPGGTEWSFNARVQDELMRLSGATAAWDFNGDGTPEPATWNMRMTN